MVAYRRGLHIAAVIGTFATFAGAPARLAAQGGAQEERFAARATAPESATATARVEELARDVLEHLAGTWRFEVRFAGNFSGAPDATGTRVFEPLYNHLRLQWSETLDSPSDSAKGIIGFDSENGGFYSTAVYSSGSGVELLTGVLDLAEPVVTFRPATGSTGASSAQQGMESFTLRVIDANHFTWSPLDRGWRAVFTRQP
jgi:hypothetical protein